MIELTEAAQTALGLNLVEGELLDSEELDNSRKAEEESELNSIPSDSIPYDSACQSDSRGKIRTEIGW